MEQNCPRQVRAGRVRATHRLGEFGSAACAIIGERGATPGETSLPPRGLRQVNILALVSDGFGAPGGIARYNQDLVTALARSEAVGEIAVVPRHGETLESLPVGVTQVSPLADRFAWSLRAIRLVLARQFDVIFCGHLFAAPVAAALSRIT